MIHSRSRLSLKGAHWLSDPNLRFVLSALDESCERVKIVGGAVRNTLAGRPVKDIDLATSLVPEEVVERANKHFIRAIPRGFSHGVVMLVYEGRCYEVATLRQDVETDGRRAQVCFTEDWSLDAARRDFTMNALYSSPGGDVFDPFGGYDDILSHCVRFIGNPSLRIAEDYLRIMRFFRFSADFGKGNLDREGLDACIRMRAHLRSLSPDRLGSECLLLLELADPLPVLSVMADTGILYDIFGGMVSVNSLARYMTFERALSLPPDPIRRLLVLGCRGLEDVERLKSRLALPRVASIRLETAIRNYGELRSRTGEWPWKELIYRCGSERYRDLVSMGAIHGLGNSDAVWQKGFLVPEYWSVQCLPWSGADVLRHGIVSSGQAVGTILRCLERAWMDSDFPQDPGELERIFHEVCTAYRMREGEYSGRD